MAAPQPADRSRLLEILLQHGILHASPTQPVLSRDGSSARWMLDSLCVSLDPEGIELASRCLCALLERFQGRQIATYGVTAIPLLTACIQRSGGRYRGLLVRKARKDHGSRKLIEGRIDPLEPVIILDDSVSSGTTMTACCDRLEEAGLRVEGGVCLVRFGWYGGFALMQERGYQMETVFDIWSDFMAQMENETPPVSNPTKIFPELKWRQASAPEGLHPARLARHMMDAYLDSGELPRPPVRLDKAYDASGGTWVSIRSRSNIHLRHARDGFWHFPEEDGASDRTLGRDLALAALKTASGLPAGDAGKAALEESAIAVTFFSRLEACTVGELDNDRFGIVVRSLERPGRMGGALPRMPGIVTPWQQFQHARMKNAELVSFEPYELLRHGVAKAVEPGEAWQPTGVPKGTTQQWHGDPAQAGRIALQAHQLVLQTLGLTAAEKSDAEIDALADAPFIASIDTLFVTIYLQGQLRGCMGTKVSQLADDLRTLVSQALTDQRFTAPAGTLTADQVAVTVSLLYNRLELGDFSPQEVMQRVRYGEQVLTVYQGDRIGTLLPFVAAAYNLDPTAYALEVIDKAGITRPPYSWRRFDCVTWLADEQTDEEGRVRPLRGALPCEPAASSLDGLRSKLTPLLRRYLLRHQRQDGSLFFRYHPHQDVVYEGGDLPRSAHGAWVLSRAGILLDDPDLEAAGRKLVSRLLDYRQEDEQGGLWLVDGQGRPSIAELSFLLLALCELPEHAAAEPGATKRGLAETLWRQIDVHGRIATHREPRETDGPFQDYFPGQALLALAAARRAGWWEVPEADRLHRAFGVYRHRFRNRRHFGQVSWLMQAFTAWWQVLQEAEVGAFVFEIADWLLGFQQVDDGGFLNDHQSDSPGYTTALYLEGLGCAVKLAQAMGEAERASRYRTAYQKGLAFVDSLVIQEHMAPLLPNPGWAIGGVRSSLGRDEVRIDFVQHALSAVLELHPGAEQGEGR